MMRLFGSAGICQAATETWGAKAQPGKPGRLKKENDRHDDGDSLERAMISYRRSPSTPFGFSPQRMQKRIRLGPRVAELRSG